MRILIASSYLPYPLFSGGHIRLYNLIKQLSAKHEITLVCEKRSNQTEQDREALAQICKEVIVVDRNKQWSLPVIAKTGFSSFPFLMVGHTNLQMKKEIKALLDRQTFDLIHVETFYVMQNVPRTHIPIVLVEHNIEYLVYSRFANIAPLPLRPLLFYDIWKMKYWEKYFWQKATKLVAVSQEEKKLMGQDAQVVPNGVDTQKFTVENVELKLKQKEKTILFIGDFKWVQNRDAITWLIRDIWPKINGEKKLWVVGRQIPDSIKKLTTDKNIFFDEDAPEETWEIFKKAHVLIAPIRVGGGTSFKILEAMASGVAVVTTTLGIEGIDATNGQDVLIGNTTKEIVAHVNTVFSDEQLYTKIVANARDLIETKYEWEKIAKKLEEVYKSVIP